MKRILAFAAAATAVAVTPAGAQPETVDSEAGEIGVESLAAGLDRPWGMAFLPDGRLLVTERAGDLRILDTDGELSGPVEGTPEVFAQGQGGLLDVALDPDFESNRRVYLSFAEGDADGASTAVGRGRLEDDHIEDFEVVFSQEPKVSGPNHFGGRIAFADGGELFLTLGDRFKGEPAQELSNHLGTVVRVNRDGSVPEDNPFVDDDDALEEIWSYGHRNIEAAAIHPDTGALWVAEMGPQGGDELNLIEAGNNYGWPEVSWGEHYDGEDIPDPTTEPDFADAIRHWTPVISPSGMAFYSGDAFPEWRGDMLIGGLTAHGIVRLEVDGDEVTEEQRIDLDTRIRDVEEGPDGAIYVLTDEDDGHVLRLTPRD